MHKLLKDLSSTNSIIEKTDILNKYKNDIKIKTLIELALDSNKQTFIKKIDKVTKYGKSTLLQVYDEFIILFNKLSNRKVTGNAARDEVNLFLSKCDEDAYDFYVKVLKKDLKCGFGIALVERVWGKNSVHKFAVQLANKYEPSKNYKVDNWYASPKMDGLRCVYDYNKLVTRQGKPIVGFEHIEEELQQLSEEYNFTLIDGELYSDKLNFQTLQGYITSNKNYDSDDKKKVYYNIFYVGLSENAEEIDTKTMVDKLNKIDWSKYKYLKKVQYYNVKNKEADIVKLAEEIVAKGYEGLMLRHPDKSYEFKRSNAILKYKFFQEEDFKIVDLQLGTGKYENVLGKITVVGKVGNKKIISDCGSGFSDELRTEMWKNKNSYINKIVEIKFQNITDSPDENGNYSLRFPVFLKTKEDR